MYFFINKLHFAIVAIKQIENMPMKLIKGL